MNDQYYDFGEKLQDAINRMNLPISLNEEQKRSFYIFYQDLVEKNKVMNLTSITDEKDVILKHFADSIALILAVPDLKEKKYKTLDLGTGAGFPGIPLAIAYPEMELTLADSLNKRISFIKEETEKLGLKNVNAVHSRAEELAKDQSYREGFDLCVSRAVANLSTLSEYCIPFIHINGFFIPYKSGNVEDEILQSSRALKILKGKMEKTIHYSLPEGAGERTLLLIKKEDTTPKTTAEDAKTVIEYARGKDLGRVTLLPMTLLNPNPLTEKERALLSEPGVVGLGSELVGCDKRCAIIAEYLLGRTVIVEDLDSAIRLRKKSKSAFHIATLLGDFLATGGTMTGGSIKKGGFSLLGREREVEEIKKQLKKAEQAVADKQKEIEDQKKQILLKDTQIDAFVSAAHGDELELVHLKEQREIIERDLRDAEEAMQELCDERNDLNESLAEIENRRRSAATVEDDIKKQNLLSTEDIRKEQLAIAQDKQKREELSAQLTEQRIRAMALEKEADAREAERRRLERDLQLTEQKIGMYDAEIQTLSASVEAADERLAEMERSIHGEQEELKLAKEEQSKLETERTRVNELLSQFRRERDGIQDTVRGLDERRHKNEIQASRLEMELKNSADRIWEEYELTYENALPMRREIAVGATQSRVNALKTEIRGLGDINVSAIEDYKAVSERHESLSAQFSDLEKAKADLYTLIGQLTQTMEQTFVREFQKIQTNFADTFEQLFGGGHAELRLSDRNDVLNCDIDIIAQPPGKKLQLLSLLSGGERALTAIALLFAMLKRKAPAFCVLDEIETSLDEANVSKFANYLTEYSDETQFIIITHRKGSMEVCDTLYGVAMEEKGISSIVSARFGETA